MTRCVLWWWETQIHGTVRSAGVWIDLVIHRARCDVSLRTVVTFANVAK